jgi:16S rRNA (guanine(966)-N(2))-methyltransferase RsmD
MENRRQPENPSTKPYNRNKPFSNSNTNSNSNSSGKGYGYKSYQSTDNRNSNDRNSTDNRNFQKRDDRFQDRNGQNQTGRDNRFQDRNERGGENRFQPRGERSERFQGKENNGGFKSRDNRFQSRDNRDNRFAKPGGKFQPRNNKFQGKKPFFPKGKTTKPWDDERNKPRLVSDMQVTEGKHRGKFMVSTASPKVKPTARRLREVMFRILYRKIRAKRFLDLCAGSGTVGIEAVSRGALLGTFVERSARMCSFVKKNLATCAIKDGHGEVFEMEVVPFLKEMKKRKRCWDVVYFDPPYDADYDEVLKYLSRGTALNIGGTLVIEHHAEMFFPEKIGQLKRWRVVVQGDSALSFFERK